MIRCARTSHESLRSGRIVGVIHRLRISAERAIFAEFFLAHMLQCFKCMERGKRSIKDVVTVVLQGDGEEIAVVLCDDEKYGLAQNGRVIESLAWPLDQLEECVAFAERFAQTRRFDFEDDGFSQQAN